MKRETGFKNHMKQMALKHIKTRSFGHYVEMQIKTTVTYYFSPIRLASLRRAVLLVTDGTTTVEQLAVHNTITYELMTPTTLLLGICPEDMHPQTQNSILAMLFTVVLFVV